VPPGEFITGLELGWVGQEAWLLVLTTGRLLFVATTRPVRNHYALPIDQIVDVISQVGPDGSGMLSVQMTNARIDILGVTAATRFRDVIAAYGTPGFAARGAPRTRRSCRPDHRLHPSDRPDHRPSRRIPRQGPVRRPPDPP
jgi:hypothetical protein